MQRPVLSVLLLAAVGVAVGVAGWAFAGAFAEVEEAGNPTLY